MEVEKSPKSECPECGYSDDNGMWAYLDEGEQKEWTCAKCGEKFSDDDL